MFFIGQNVEEEDLEVIRNKFKDVSNSNQDAKSENVTSKKIIIEQEEMLLFTTTGAGADYGV